MWLVVVSNKPECRDSDFLADCLSCTVWYLILCDFPGQLTDYDLQGGLFSEYKAAVPQGIDLQFNQSNYSKIESNPISNNIIL